MNMNQRKHPAGAATAADAALVRNACAEFRWEPSNPQVKASVAADRAADQARRRLRLRLRVSARRVLSL